MTSIASMCIFDSKLFERCSIQVRFQKPSPVCLLHLAEVMHVDEQGIEDGQCSAVSSSVNHMACCNATRSCVW